MLVSPARAIRQPGDGAWPAIERTEEVKVDADLLAENEASHRQLAALVARLTDDDLARDVGGGWTVAMALAHLGFWDARAALLLERYAEGAPHHHIPEWYEGLFNEALEAQWRALEPRAAAEHAVAAAEHASTQPGRCVASRTTFAPTLKQTRTAFCYAASAIAASTSSRSRQRWASALIG
jgi:hypothetical protein